MGELIRQTLNELMQMATEQIALGNDSLSLISVWANIAEEYGELWVVEYD